MMETGQRKSNVAEMEWSELDLVRKHWTIPAEKWKTDKDHIVPLSDTTVALLQSIPDYPRDKVRAEGSRGAEGFSSGLRKNSIEPANFTGPQPASRWRPRDRVHLHPH
jgi:integrase